MYEKTTEKVFHTVATIADMARPLPVKWRQTLLRTFILRPTGPMLHCP